MKARAMVFAFMAGAPMPPDDLSCRLVVHLSRYFKGWKL